MTTPLRDIQEQFQAHIQDNDTAIRDAILEMAPASVDTRIFVYREGYYLRLKDIMSRNFDMLKKYIGDEAFEKLANAYIAAYHSNHFNVRSFSRHMSKFLANYSDLKTIHQELATFEWELALSLDAPDGDQLTLDDLKNVPAESWGFMKLKMHPSARILKLHYDVPLLWSALYHDKDLPEMTNHEEAQPWLVWRFNQIAHYLSLNQHQCWMFEQFQNEKNFAEICEGLCEWLQEEEVPQFAATTLSSWIQQGLVSELTY